MRILSYGAAADRYHDYVNIAPTPHDEPCTQVGSPHYQDGKFECQVFARQLIRVYGEPPQYAEIFLLRNEHELGTYFDVNVRYRMPDEDTDVDDMGPGALDVYRACVVAEEYALKLEAGCEKWDDIARAELLAAKHHLFVPQPEIEPKLKIAKLSKGNKLKAI